MWHPNRSQWLVFWIAVLVALVYWVAGGPKELMLAMTPEPVPSEEERYQASMNQAKWEQLQNIKRVRRHMKNRVSVALLVIGILLWWQLAGTKKKDLWQLNCAQSVVVWVTVLTALVFWVAGGPEGLILVMTAPEQPIVELTDSSDSDPFVSLVKAADPYYRALEVRERIKAHVPAIALVIGVLLVWQLAGPKKKTSTRKS